MAERLTAIFADQIADLALSDGLMKVVADDTKMQIRLELDGAISFDAVNKGLQVEVDDSTLQVNVSNDLEVKDGGITEPKLDVSNAPVTGYFLQWDGSDLTWADPNSGAVLDSEVICNEIPAGLINSSNVTYTIANAPVAGTVTVYLNGLFQAPGTGKDYTISGQTITFAKAPRTNSELYVCYIEA